MTPTKCPNIIPDLDYFQEILNQRAASVKPSLSDLAFQQLINDTREYMRYVESENNEILKSIKVLSDKLKAMSN